MFWPVRWFVEKIIFSMGCTLEYSWEAEWIRIFKWGIMHNGVPGCIVSPKKEYETDPKKKVIIFFRPRGTNLNVHRRTLEALAPQFDCNMVGFEFFGTPPMIISSRNFSMPPDLYWSWISEEVIKDAIAVYNDLSQTFESKNIYFMGSRETTPLVVETVDRIIKSKERVGGMILLSPQPSLVATLSRTVASLCQWVDPLWIGTKLPKLGKDKVPCLLFYAGGDVLDFYDMPHHGMKREKRVHEYPDKNRAELLGGSGECPIKDCVREFIK